MSVYYEIKEHLRITGAAANNLNAIEARGIMNGGLASLAGLMVLGEGRLYQLHLTADGKTYDIVKSEITPLYSEVVAALYEAEEIDLTVDYGFCWRANGGLYELVGPFEMLKHFEDPEDDDMTGIFYSAWNNADCSDGNGILSAYGEHNGKTYNGTVEYAAVSEVPAGNWEAKDTVIWLEPDDFDAQAHPEVISACEALQELSDDTTLETDNGFLFSINNLMLRCPEDGRRFIERVTKLGDLMQEKFCGIMGNFADTEGKDARLMIIDEADSGYTIKVAQV